MDQTLLVECFLAPRKETLGLIPTEQGLGTKVHVSNPSTQEVEEGKSEIQSHPAWANYNLSK